MRIALTPFLLLGLLIPVSETSAQQANPAPVSVNPPGPPPVVAIMPVPVPTHLLFLFETYTLSQDALDAIHLEAPEAGPFYDRVRKQGALDSVIAMPTRSGQRATIESIDEVIYPTEFDPPVPGRNFAYPTAHEMRPTGHRIELDPVLGPDETTVYLNMAPEFTRLAGFVQQKASETSPGELQPLFVTRKFTNATACFLGVPTLLGTSSAPKQTGIPEADGDGSVAVTFVTARLSGPTMAMPPANPPPSTGTGNLRLVFRFYSLPRTTARELLVKTEDPDKLFTLVRALPSSDVKLERLLTMETRSGQRATVEEIAENIYGTEMEPPHPPLARDKRPAPAAPAPQPVKTEGQTTPPAPPTPVAPAPVYRGKDSLPASFTAFEMRPLGWRIEVEPVVEPDGSVDLNVVPEHAEHRGHLQGHAMLARYPEQPVFSCQKITTSVVTQVGHQCLLGTFNAPHDTGVNGRKDDGRAWLAFVIPTME